MCIEAGTVSAKSDIYSFGMTILEVGSSSSLSSIGALNVT